MKKTIAVSSLLSLLLSFQAMADNSRIVNLDERGDRKGNRMNKRLDRRAH